MTFLERRLIVFFTANMYSYHNAHQVELEFSEPDEVTASAYWEENRDEDWYISVSVQNTISLFSRQFAIGQIADLDTITPAMLKDLYHDKQATVFLLYHGTALWFEKKGNSTHVTGDLQAITFETLSAPGDFLQIGQRLIINSGIEYGMKVIHSKKDGIEPGLL